MITILNMTHPLTRENLSQIATLLNKNEDQLSVLHRSSHFNYGDPFPPQAFNLVDSFGLTTEQWQKDQIVLIPPSFSPIVALVISILHGKMGHFPTILYAVPIGGVTTSYHYVGLINLQDVRNKARVIR